MTNVLLTATLAVSTAALLVLFYLVRKARWIIGRLNRLGMQNQHHFKHLFRDVQILAALHDQLKLPHPLPPTGGMAATPDFLKAIADYALAVKPQTIVECGSGISTVVLARCMQLNGTGHVYSMEHEPGFAQITRNDLARQGLTDWATVLDAPLEVQAISGHAAHWYRTDGVPDRIDMLIVDGPPANVGAHPRYPAGPRLFGRVAGAIFVDDAARQEELVDVDRWRRQFPAFRFEVNTQEFQKGLCVGTPK